MIIGRKRSYSESSEDDNQELLNSSELPLKRRKIVRSNIKPNLERKDCQVKSSVPQPEEEEDVDLDYTCSNKDNDQDNESIYHHMDGCDGTHCNCNVPDIPDLKADDENEIDFVNDSDNTDKKKYRNWFITENNYQDNIIKMIEKWAESKSVKYLIYCLEVGKKKQTKHLHISVVLKNGTTFNAIKKRFPRADIGRTHEVGKSITYCMKAGNYKEFGIRPKDFKKAGQHGGYAKRDKIYKLVQEGKSLLEIIDIVGDHAIHICKHIQSVIDTHKSNENKKALKAYYEKAELRPWQTKCLDKLNEQNDRHVLWVYDPEGNTGKSWLAKYLYATKDALYATSGKKADVAYMWDHLNQDLVVFDFSRTTEERVNYDTIESMKNGLIMSGKYESKVKSSSKTMKVVVFANWMPDLKAMSLDRWDIMELENNNIKEWTQSDITQAILEQRQNGFHFE